MNTTELGNVIRKIRQRRGILFKEIDAPVSISTLSRVENGQSSLTLGDLSQVLNELGCTVAEVLGHLDTTTPYPEVWAAFERAARKEDSKALDGIVTQYQNRQDYIGRLIWLTAVGWQSTDFSSRFTDSNQVEEFLELMLRPQPWYQFEYDILVLAINYLPSKPMQTLIRRAAVEYSRDQNSVYEESLMAALFNAAYIADQHHDKALVDLMLGVLRGIPVRKNTVFIKHRMKLLELALHFRFYGEGHALEQIAQLISAMRLIGATEFADEELRWIESMRIALPDI
ncbi:helix-turn-helix domain-containing protein [Lacticaseibacillus parakribbianus]|uniref:helix-turn-helix domain-containing protein n=1 Tax=Lacticaseibacillus parakribbianus TaxID=2970927 RepID=UPI0021CB0D0D|nr:helix-turn-helix transcriptional regulator [Lacticaseibacillus parakribbianus]